MKRSSDIRKARSVLDLMSITGYIDHPGCFSTSYGFMDVYRIPTRNMQAMGEDEKDYEIMLWQRFYQNFDDDVKIVSVICPVDTSVPAGHFRKRLEAADDPVRKDLISVRIHELETIASSFTERRYYLFVYASSLDNMKRDQIRVETLMEGRVDRMEKHDKADVLKNILDQKVHPIMGGRRS